jgi:EpsI family protein
MSATGPVADAAPQGTPPRSGLPLRTALLVAALLAAAPPVAELLRPTRRTADIKGAIQLAAQVPEQFGDWRLDHGITPLLPDPQLQATLDATYSQVLARTYVNARRQRVMLSIAYGNDQSSEATAVHRPEFCYRAQGFDVRDAGQARLALPGAALQVQRLVGRLGPREEPITYWITLDETATLPGLGRKLQQIRYGLRGFIADGMVVRVSTVGTGEAAGFALQEQFLAQMRAALPAAYQARYFGS